MPFSLCIAFSAALVAAAAEPNHMWGGFRGTGDSHTQIDLPLSWSDRHNIAWKIKTPGFGQSTPVSAGGRIFFTAIDGKKKETLLIVSLDASTGKEIWKKSFPSSRPQEVGDRVARAAPTPALDERGLYAMFDSGDLIALDHDGGVLWKKNFNEEYGVIQNGHDFGSSLRQSGNTLFAFVNHVGPSYLVSIAKKDGATKWKADFPAEGGWNTPLVVTQKSSAKPVLLLQRKGGVAGYDPENGKLLWEDLREFGRESAIPSLSAYGETVVVPSNSKGGSWAFHLDNPKQSLWTAKAATNAYSSPLLTAKRAYFVNAVGALFAVDLATGKDLWSTRLASTTWASALHSNGRVYFFTGDGSTYIFKDADTMEKIAENHLDADATVYAAAPLADGLLIRTGTSLWKVKDLGQKDPTPELSKNRAPASPVASAGAEPPPLPPPAPGTKAGETRVNTADGLKVVWIPAGNFQMGCSADDAECEKDEKPSHKVTLSRGFWLSQTEVTVGAFKKFAAATNRKLPEEPALFTTKLNPGWIDESQPMVRVSRSDAQAYCRWSGGRLPTEAEWEYAARAGSSASRYSPLADIGWYGDNSGTDALDTTKLAREQRGAFMPTLAKNGNRPRSVASKKANAFGLFDMIGNVAEWTSDWHDLYIATDVVDPKGAADGEKRVARGGAWNFPPSSLRVSTRLKLSIDASNDFTGFRCAQ